MGLAEGAVLKRAVSKDSVVTAADVQMPAERLSDRLWAEQLRRWTGTGAPAGTRAPETSEALA
jgi:predicted homoserine dehydrogenase-like protein